MYGIQGPRTAFRGTFPYSYSQKFILIVHIEYSNLCNAVSVEEAVYGMKIHMYPFDLNKILYTILWEILCNVNFNFRLQFSWNCSFIEETFSKILKIWKVATGAAIFVVVFSYQHQSDVTCSTEIPKQYSKIRNVSIFCCTEKSQVFRTRIRQIWSISVRKRVFRTDFSTMWTTHKNAEHYM